MQKYIFYKYIYISRIKLQQLINTFFHLVFVWQTFPSSIQANIHTPNQRNILTQAIQTHLTLYFCILITLDTTKLKEFLRLVSCFQERKGSIIFIAKLGIHRCVFDHLCLPLYCFQIQNVSLFLQSLCSPRLSSED